MEHDHRALGLRRARVDDAVAAGAQVLVRLGELDQLERDAAALERRAHALAERRREHDRVAGQQRRTGLQHRLRPRRRGAAAHADDADRRRLQHGSPPGPQHGDPAEPLVAQRARAVVGEVVQAADRRQQLGEHALGPRLADDVGERVGQRVELVEDRGRRAPQVASPPRRGDQRPQRLRGPAVHRPERLGHVRGVTLGAAAERLAQQGAEAVRAALVDHERVGLRARREVDRADPDHGLAAVDRRAGADHGAARRVEGEQARDVDLRGLDAAAGQQLRDGARVAAAGEAEPHRRAAGRAWVRANGEGMYA